MFDSKHKLAEEVRGLLDALREMGGGRYACLVDPKGTIVFESPEPEGREVWALRRLLEDRGAALFAIPRAMASGEPLDDVFEGWSHDELFLAFLNERVVVVVACPEAETLKEQALKPLKALADRLFRYDETYRMDPKGRGFFFGRAKLDMVVIGRAGADDR